MKNNLLNEYLTNLRNESSLLYNSFKLTKFKLILPFKKTLKYIISIACICSFLYFLINYDAVQVFLICGLACLMVIGVIYAVFNVVFISYSIKNNPLKTYDTLISTILVIVFIISWISLFSVCEYNDGNITF